jgi:ATP-dependent Clp protease adaptor protein ClpS
MQETQVRPKAKSKEKTEQKERRQPPYHVVLLNDDDHSFEYVILMCHKLFGHPVEKGFAIAQQVDTEGRSIVWTGALELAELKRDQIHAFGADPLIRNCQGSMSAELEEAE